MSDFALSHGGRAMALSLIIAAACMSSACQRTPSPEAKPDAAPAVTRAPFDAMLSVVNNSGKISFDGTVGDAAIKSRIEQSLLSVYGAGRAAGDIAVDSAARPATWVEGLSAFLKIFEPLAGAALRFEGDRIVLSGKVDLEQRRSLRAAAESAFPDARLEGLFTLPTGGNAVASGKIIAPDVVAKTLNQMPLTFENGGGNVSADSLTLVAQAADSIRAAPPGTRLLIVGPVVATTDNGNDIFLSKQRAEALKVQLILNGVSPASIETRGWGQNTDGTAVEGATPPPEGSAIRFELLK